MLQDAWEMAADSNLFTDASGTLGFGACFQGAWIMGTWLTAQFSRSIQWKELFAIVAAGATWGGQWQRTKILVYCDNQAVVQVRLAKNLKHPILLSYAIHCFFWLQKIVLMFP